eukprot:INCI10450.2.p1 GENE.INCI10450.2~~INCI10450.2.p1  ORF type:complete len:3195 (-),score=394.60 INCI10450.2:2128-11712(-)
MQVSPILFLCTLVALVIASIASVTADAAEASICGVLPVINTHLTDQEVAAISENVARLQQQGLFTSVVRLDLGPHASSKPVEGADQTWTVSTSPKVAVPSQRERLLSLGWQRLPSQCESIVLFEDANVQFLENDWVGLTLEALRTYDVVQPFSFVYNRRHGDGAIEDVDFDGDMLFASTMGHEPGQLFYGAAYGFHLLRNFDMHRGVAVEKLHGYGGGAWVFRRSFLEDVGGIFDAALNQADAFSLLSKTALLATPPSSTEAASSALASWQSTFRRRLGNNIGFVAGAVSQEVLPSTYVFEDGDEDLPASDFGPDRVHDGADGIFEWTVVGQRRANDVLAWYEGLQLRPLVSAAETCETNLPRAACKWLTTVREIYARERSGRTRRLMTGTEPDFGTCKHSDSFVADSDLSEKLFPSEGRALQDDTCYEVVASDFLPVGSDGGLTAHAIFRGVSWGDCADFCNTDRNCLAFGYGAGGLCYVFSAAVSRYENMCPSITPAPAPSTKPDLILDRNPAPLLKPRISPAPARMVPAPTDKGDQAVKDIDYQPSPEKRNKRRRTPSPEDRPTTTTAARTTTTTARGRRRLWEAGSSDAVGDEAVPNRNLYVLAAEADYDCNVRHGEDNIESYKGVALAGIDVYGHICEVPAPQENSISTDREYQAVENHYCSARDSFVIGDPTTSASGCKAQCLAFDTACDTFTWISDVDHEDYGRCVLFWGCTRLTYNQQSEFKSYVWCDYKKAHELGVFCYAPSPSIDWYAESERTRVKTYSLTASGVTSKTHYQCAQQCESYAIPCDAFQWTADSSLVGFGNCKLFWDPTAVAAVTVNITTYVRCMYDGLAGLGMSCDSTTAPWQQTETFTGQLRSQYCSAYDGYFVYDSVTEEKCKQLCEENDPMCDAYQFFDDSANSNYRRCVLFAGCSTLATDSSSAFFSRVRCDYDGILDLRLSCSAPAPTTLPVEQTTTIPDVIPGPEKPLMGWAQGERSPSPAPSHHIMPIEDACYEIASRNYVPVGPKGGSVLRVRFLTTDGRKCADRCNSDPNCMGFMLAFNRGQCWIYTSNKKFWEGECFLGAPAPAPRVISYYDDYRAITTTTTREVRTTTTKEQIYSKSFFDCELVGTCKIATSEECGIAAEELGLSDVTPSDQFKVDKPTGCYFGNARLKFNFRDTKVSPGLGETAICKKCDGRSYSSYDYRGGSYDYTARYEPAYSYTAYRTDYAPRYVSYRTAYDTYTSSRYSYSPPTYYSTRERYYSGTVNRYSYVAVTDPPPPDYGRSYTAVTEAPRSYAYVPTKDYDTVGYSPVARSYSYVRRNLASDDAVSDAVNIAQGDLDRRDLATSSQCKIFSGELSINNTKGKMFAGAVLWMDVCDAPAPAPIYPAPSPAGTCSDGVLNNGEKEVDCGGQNCRACPTCSDGIFNGLEDALDCGGSCLLKCTCYDFGNCTCSDGIQNGMEEGIDCGLDAGCEECATCSDGILNGDETGTDCGGPDCSSCSCKDGEINNGEKDYVTGDVTSGECGNFVCGPCPTCSDGVMNGDEEGTDCGGTYRCKFPCTCSDGEQNQLEEGTDCGGPNCDPCTCDDDEINQGELEWVAGVAGAGECGGENCAMCPNCTDGVWNGDEDGTDCVSPDREFNQARNCSACSCHDDEVNQGEEGYVSREHNLDYIVSDLSDGQCGGDFCDPCPTCSDGEWNGDEQGTDCGSLMRDCKNCTCSDGELNQGEFFVDCGGPNCPPCTTCSDGEWNGGEEGTDCGGTNYDLELYSFVDCPPCSCTDGEINQGEEDYTNGTAMSGCVNAFDELHKEELCELYINEYGLQCDVYFCKTCPYAERCDMTCGYCTDYECGGPCADCPTCSDGIWNGDETGTDCGSTYRDCAPCSCEDGELNQGEEDWVNGTEGSGECGGPCDPCPTCSDGLWNGDETGTDCGSIVRFCKECSCFDGEINQGEGGGLLGGWVNSSANSGECGGEYCKICPTCSDGIWNGDERGTDCGGPNCTACTCFDGEINQGEEDLVDGTKASGECGGPFCDPCPTCSDGAWNGDESGTDCGSDYRSCDGCSCEDGEINQGEGGGFLGGWTDLTQTFECGGPLCDACPTCSDGLLNGDEEGLDCGGPNCTECSCFDNELNRDEVDWVNGTNTGDIDGESNGGGECGGIFCDPCPTCSDGIWNGDEQGTDCNSNDFPDNYRGCEPCSCDDGEINQGEGGGLLGGWIDSSHLTGECGGPCDPCPTCSDGIHNGDENGTDCGGPNCTACTCFDGELNQGELDWVDGTPDGGECGGDMCDPCPTCSDGLWNGDENGTDCSSHYRHCDTNCTCDDGEVNQGEERFMDYERYRECGGDNCNSCPTCSDGKQNGDETGIDCGGPRCQQCGCPNFGETLEQSYGDSCTPNEWCNNETGAGAFGIQSTEPMFSPNGVCEFKCVTLHLYHPEDTSALCHDGNGTTMLGEYCNSVGSCTNCSDCSENLILTGTEIVGSDTADGRDCWHDVCCAEPEYPDADGFTCAYWVFKRGKSCWEMTEKFNYDCHCTCLDAYYEGPSTTPEPPGDPCRPDPCIHGTCVPADDLLTSTCECSAGWTGKFCDDSVVDFNFGDDELWELLEPLLTCAANVYCGYHGDSDKCSEPEDTHGYRCSDYVAYGLATCAQMIEYYEFPEEACLCDCANYTDTFTDCFGDEWVGSDEAGVDKQWWIGDGWCDDHLNCAQHNYDGGDCCKNSCDGLISECGAAGYNCVDPSSTHCDEPTDYSGKDCAYWVGQGFSCQEMVDVYGYHCPCTCSEYLENDDSTCFEKPDLNGHTCSFWVDSMGYTCDEMISDYGYDCNCACDSSSDCVEARDMDGISCSYWINQGYSCDEMISEYGYDCSCACSDSDIYTDTGACSDWQSGYECPNDVEEWYYLSMGNQGTDECMAACSHQSGEICCWYGNEGSGNDRQCWFGVLVGTSELPYAGLSDAAVCSAPSAAPITTEAPSEWECAPMWYNNLDGCDCGCGAVDPDCLVEDQDVYGCSNGQTCSAEGTCVGDFRTNKDQCWCLSECTDGSDGWDPWCNTIAGWAYCSLCNGGGSATSCMGNCGGMGKGCFCDEHCSEYGDCCDDFDDYCGCTDTFTLALNDLGDDGWEGASWVLKKFYTGSQISLVAHTLGAGLGQDEQEVCVIDTTVCYVAEVSGLDLATATDRAELSWTLTDSAGREIVTGSLCAVSPFSVHCFVAPIA